MTDFLLELRCEEIPARMQAGARAELEKLFRREMAAAGVAAGDVTAWSTPRRLALIARSLPEESEARTEETRGPKVEAPHKAIEGFRRSRGRGAISHLTVRDGHFWDVVDHPGLSTHLLLAKAIPAIIRDFSWPKSMRWGAASLSTESLRWVRPLSGIVALLGEDLVECAVDGIASGYATLGHRFHCPGEITIGSAADYQEKLRACHVIVDHEERAAIIRDGAARAAADAGLALVADEGLVVENAGLTEWPVPLLGRFDEAFLDVPPEVIQLTARVNQKYFVCTRSPAQAGGSMGSAQPAEVPAFAGTQELANAFVCTANIDAGDPALVVDGNRKVLAARLSDARFFWEQDRKVPLADHAQKLERITFHEKLGSVADKVERVAKLARWLVEEGIVTPLPKGEGPGVGGATPDLSNTHPQPLPSSEGASLADLAEQAARLCKADLVTEMVGEFPELQGLMGGYYARAEGLPDEVADAIRDHYKPVGQGDDVPTAPVTVAVSLADKLDTLVGFFLIDEKPSGSKDPFALRRAALAVAALIQKNDIRLSLRRGIFDHFATTAVDIQLRPTRRAAEEVVTAGRNHVRVTEIERLRTDILSSKIQALRDQTPEFGQSVVDAVMDLKWFLIDRLKVQQREAGVRHDLIDAVVGLGGEDDLVRLLARVHALQSFIETDNGTNLLAAYKRAANILKKEDWPASPLPTGEGPGVGAPTPDNPASLSPLTGGGASSGDVLNTGDEDPMENVDDPLMREIYAAQLSAHAYPPEPAESALIAALDAAEPRADAAIAAEDFAAAMAALASLRAPIDAFFDQVTVNDADAVKRAARLSLLARFRAAVHNVADFSKIEG